MEFGLSAEAQAAIAKRFPNAFRSDGGPTWQQQILARGWGYAVIVATSIQADNGEGLTQGIIGLVNKGQPRQLDEWGALRAWAWGASRALDEFGSRAASNDREIPRPLVSVQAAFVARRFGLSATAARIVAQHAFTNGRA